MIAFVSTFSLRSPAYEGLFSTAVDETGSLIATAFGGLDALRRRARWTSEQVDDRRNAAARREIEAYFGGELNAFSVPLAPQGSAFQQRVWSELARIPFGHTRSYGALAVELGSSARAVGRANANNPICLIVPCHRVIGANGSLTGFAFGEEVKRRLLKHEGALA